MASSKTTGSDDTKQMEFSVDRDTMLAEVTAAARASENKSTQPILAHLLLDASVTGSVTITSTDLNRSIRTECPAQVSISGTVAVPSQKFLSYLKLLPSGPVHLKGLANDHVQIHSGKSRTRMAGRAASGFPSLSTPPAHSVQLGSRVLRTLVRQSIFAVATSDDRYLLKAALLLLRPDRAGMVATDGHRLSFVVVPDDGISVQGVQKALLPRECLSDLLSLLSATKEEAVQFSEDDATLYFQIGLRLLSIRKLVGRFPDYEAILPKGTPNSMVIRSAELMTSIQRVLEFSDERSNGVKFHLADNTLKISSSAPDRGESEETLPVSYSADPITIGFNGNYLVEFLRTIGEKGSMRFSIKDSTSAGVLIPENMDAEFQQQYVVMPMRV